MPAKANGLVQLTRKIQFDMNQKEIFGLAFALRQEHRFAEAYDLLCNYDDNSDSLKLLRWQHQPFLWQPLISKKIILTRKNSSHAHFVKSLWNNKEFMHDFHRLSPPLVDNEDQLKMMLDNEYASIFSEFASLQWIISDTELRPYGIVSFNEISLAHKRAELMLGVLRDTPFYVATTAALMATDFFFDMLHFDKIYCLIFADNDHSFKTVEHLGFLKEGTMTRHILDPQTLQRVDILQFGAFRENLLVPNNIRLKRKLGIKT